MSMPTSQGEKFKYRVATGINLGEKVGARATIPSLPYGNLSKSEGSIEVYTYTRRLSYQGNIITLIHSIEA